MVHGTRGIRALAAAALVVGGLAALTGTPVEAAGSCTIRGTDGDDLLRGTSEADVICGLGGDDKIIGLGGDDVLRGGPGADVLRGGRGADRLVGGADDDELFGQAGDDVLRGDSGDDEVTGGGGADRLGGGLGDDIARALDGARHQDRVRCGDGDDRVDADTGDRVRDDCEHVEQNDPPTYITLYPAVIVENEFEGSDIGDLRTDDPDEGDEVTFSLVSGPGDDDNARVGLDGEAVESADEFDFETDPELSIRVRATDLSGASIERVLTIEVRDANDPPVAGDDQISGTQGSYVDAATNDYYGLAGNDTDQDGDSLTIVAAGNASGGEVQFLSDVIRFYPDEGACGEAAGSYDYTVSDGRGGTDTGTVSVDIQCGTGGLRS